MDLLSLSFSFRNIFHYFDLEMFFNYLLSTNGSRRIISKRQIRLSILIICYFPTFILMRFIVLKEIVLDIKYQIVCADLRLLCCSSYDGVSQVQSISRFAVFIVAVEEFCYRFGSNLFLIFQFRFSMLVLTNVCVILIL